jgi:mono/diheme cytochrome c family protein
MRTLLALTAILGLVGCVGGIDAPPQGDDDGSGSGSGSGSGTVEGKKLFDANVYGVIARADMCITCHKNGATAGGAPSSSGFVGVDAATGYSTIIGFPSVHGNFAANAKILTYVTQNGHQGKTYTQDEQSKIEAWLSKELSERGTGGTGQTPVTEKLLQSFSGCMTQTNFDTAQMATACGNLQATNNQRCKECHVSGGFAFTASDVSIEMFTRISTNRTYLQKYFMVAGAETPATAKMDLNLPLFMSVLGGTGAYIEHPRVNNTPTNNQCTQAMMKFYTSTMAASTAANGNCGPSKLLN